MQPNEQYSQISFGPKTPGNPPNNKSSLLGCLTISSVGLIILFLIGFGIYKLFPGFVPFASSSSSAGLDGEFIDMAYAPGGKVWIYTDDSFKYTQTTKSGGSHSVSTECLFCKTYMYIYDPVNKKVEKSFKTEYEDIIVYGKLFYANGKVWKISGAYGDNPATVEIYNAETGAMESDLKAFIQKYPELSAGVNNIRYEPLPNLLYFDTKDGRAGVIYDLNKEKIYPSYTEYYKELDKEKGSKSIFLLGTDGSNSARKKLYRVTGPANKMKSMTTSDGFLDNAESMKFHYQSTAQNLTPSKVYLDPEMLFSNDDFCIIIHQDQVGKTANRMLTRIDKDGTVKWEIPQNDLFEETKVTEDDPFSTTFFMKSKFGCMDGEDIIIFKQEGIGAIGFDRESGVKKWTLEF